MIDRIPLAGRPRADLAARCRIGRRSLLCRLGIAAAVAAAATLGATAPAPAQSSKTPEATSEPPKAPPRRRGISNPDAGSPGAAPSPAGKSMKDGDDGRVPGGLPGAQPKPSTPGGAGSSGG